MGIMWTDKVRYQIFLLWIDMETLVASNSYFFVCCAATFFSSSFKLLKWAVFQFYVCELLKVCFFCKLNWCPNFVQFFAMLCHCIYTSAAKVRSMYAAKITTRCSHHMFFDFITTCWNRVAHWISLLIIYTRFFL